MMKSLDDASESHRRFQNHLVFIFDYPVMTTLGEEALKW